MPSSNNEAFLHIRSKSEAFLYIIYLNEIITLGTGTFYQTFCTKKTLKAVDISGKLCRISGVCYY